MSGCYLCTPEDPAADDEACLACDARYWANPVFIFLPDPSTLPEGDS